MNIADIDPLEFRKAEFPISDTFLKRWSPRAMNNKPVGQEVMQTLFEAARWAPSAGNSQPWRFFYALRETDGFKTLYRLLDEGNQSWCHRAGALIVVCSDTLTASGKPLGTHALTTGMAVQNLLLQASFMGLVGHGMAGFDADRARTDLNLPDRYHVNCMVAIGHPGQLEELSEYNQGREKPSSRRDQSEFTTLLP